MKRLIFALIFLLIASMAFGGELLYEGYWKMYSFKPASLTSYKAANFFGADDVDYSSGSESLNNAKIKEVADAYQGSVECWVKPHFTSADTRTQYLVDLGFCVLYWDGANTRWAATVNGISINKSDTFIPTDWIHIILTWETQGTDALNLYVDGVAASTVTTAQTAGTVGTFYVAQTSSNLSQFNGYYWTRILGRDLSAAEVTALYAAGAGNADSFVVTPDTKLLMLTRDNSTSIVYHTFGKTVSAIVAGGTEATLTTAAGSDTMLEDGDPLGISGPCGDFVQAYVDGTPSSTSVLADDGAGAAVSGIEDVGVSIDCNDLYSAVAANNTIHQITTEDIGVWAWIQADIDTDTTEHIVYKYFGNGYYFKLADGIIRLYISDGVDSYYISGNTDVRDNEKHFIAAIIDRDNAANCKVYLDGYEDGTTNKSGVLGSVGSITTAGTFYMASDSTPANYFDGQLFEVGISYPADITAAGEMGAAGEILALATNPHNTAAWCNTEDYWLLDENSGTVLTGQNNNLTLSSASAWSQSAFVSRNLVADGDMESALGSISGTVDSTITVSKDTTTVKFGTQSQKIVWASSNDDTALELRSLTGVLNQSYYYRLWCYFTSIDASSDMYFKVDGSGSIVNRQLDTGTDDMGTAYATGTWLIYEGVFASDQNGAHTLSFSITGGGVGGNNADFRVDKMEVLPSLAANGGMEGIYDDESGGGGGTVNVAPLWTNNGCETDGTDTLDEELTIVHSGSKSQKVDADSNEGIIRAVSTVVGKYYTVSAYLYVSSGLGSLRLGGANLGDVRATNVSSASWTRRSISFQAKDIITFIYLVGSGTSVFYADDVSLIRDDTAAATTSTKSGYYPLNLWQVQ